MLKITKQENSHSTTTSITTENHWSDGVITIYDYNDKDADISYSSGGVNDGVHPIDLARSMVEAWTEAHEILLNIQRKKNEDN